MPTFGQYQTIREIQSTAAGTIYSARLPDSSAECVVKTFRPDPQLVSPEEIQRGAALFIERAQTQQRVASSAEHWAPIQEVGTMPGGAYYVAKMLPFSVAKLIAGRVKISGAELYRIFEGILQGLLELKRTCDRAHGNLKPTNVLMSRPGQGARLEILLADPAEASRVSQLGAEANDVFALGAIVYELVMQRSASGPEVWPIPPSASWSQLGATGETWREMCNRLLNPHPGESLNRTEPLVEYLPRLAPRGRSAWGRVLGLSALAAAIIGGCCLFSEPATREWVQTKLGIGWPTTQTVQPPKLTPEELAAQAAAQRAAQIAEHLSKAKAAATTQPQRALTELDSLLQLDPQHAEAMQLKHEIQQEQEIAQRKARVSQLLSVARSAELTGETQAALNTLDEILHLDPQNADAMQLKQKIETAQKQAKIAKLLGAARDADAHNNPQEAMASLNEVFKLDPRHAEATQLKEKIDAARIAEERRARIASLLGAATDADAKGNAPAAMAAINDILKLDPHHPDALRLKQKLDDAEAARKKQAQVAEMLGAARDAETKGDHAGASAKLDELLKLDPKNAPAIELRDQINAKQQAMAEEARRAAEREARINDLLGQARQGIEQRKPDDAKAAIAALEKLSPNHPELANLRAAVTNLTTQPATRPGYRIPDVGPIVVTNCIGMRFVEIKPGQFVMGSPTTEPGHTADELQHTVRLTRGFFIGMHPVTRGQFALFVKETNYTTLIERQTGNLATWRNPRFPQGDDHPVVCVVWDDAQAFCRWLSKKDEKTYRLPTEAQWEYACRAGGASAYPWGDNPDSGQGWCNAADQTLQKQQPSYQKIFNWSDGFVYTSPIGSFKPNSWGLYDMIGNAYQWCEDWHAPYSANDTVDPAGPAQGQRRVQRGGAWNAEPAKCRCAGRNDCQPNISSNFTGFRVIVEMP